MNILTSLTYYRPHYSGLTIYAERLALALGERGHKISVLTSHYDEATPAREVRDGVEVIRLPVRLHVSKGVVMPSMVMWGWKLARRADVIHLHLPQLDASYLALFGRLLRKPVVLTYHCDLRLPEGFVHWVANQVSHTANHFAAALANAIVTNTRDYAESSNFLRPYLPKVHPIYPPAVLDPATDADISAFREKVGIQPEQRIIGIAARLATEKGVEYLAEALPKVMEKYPTARVLFAGQHQNVFGEEAYARKLAPIIQQLGDHWTFLGNQPPAERTAFFRSCEVTVLPSLNSTESFGMVQIEAMMAGAPVIASDLPGVRQPVAISGMGRIVPPADAVALAQAIIAVLDNPSAYRGDPKSVAQQFSPLTIAEQYERLFMGIREKRERET